MMAAISAARGGAQVVLVEPNEKVGRKLYITGKGRCNVTNHCSAEELMASIPRNGKFLYSALSRFDAQATMDFFQGLGVKLKVERGNRVFPVSDKAADIIAKAHGAVDSERHKAMIELSSSVVDLSVEIASKIIGNDLSVEEQRRLAEKYLAEVGEPDER